MFTVCTACCWLKEHAATLEPPVSLLDTTSAAVIETAALVAA